MTGIFLILFLAITWWASRALAPISSLADNWGQLAGFYGSQRYLILLQNSAELRPTGGFLSAFGIVEVIAGIPVKFEIHDSYFIPDPEPSIPAPEAIKRLFSEDSNYTGWTFRDANFSPNFPTTIADIFDFLVRADKKTDFDGVLAIDLHLLEEVMRLTGPITVSGLTFDANNLFANLQFATKNFDKHNWYQFQTRKDIMGDFGKKIIKQIISTPSLHYKLISLIRKQLEEKHLLTWWRDRTLQNEFVKNNWAGELKDNPGVIQLAVVEANLGGRKSDRYLHREIENKITLDENGHLIGRLQIRFRHLGEKSYYSNQFRGHLRIFLPAGTKLTNFSGHFPERPQTSIDLRQVVFDNPIFIDPESTAELVYFYKLPDQLYTKDGLDFYLWKQPGTDADFYRTVLQIPSGMNVTSSSQNIITHENLAVWETFLSQDNQAHIDILPDTRPPLVAEQKFINQDLTKILIEFDEPLQGHPAENIDNYEIWDRDEIFPNQSDQIKVISAKYYDRGVALSVQGISNQPLERYGIRIHDGIFDKSGNALHLDSSEITVVQRVANK